MALARSFANLCIVLLLATPAGLRAAPLPSEESARLGVQSFYDWYAPKANRSHRVPAWVFAIRQRPRWFSVPLARALTADARAQAKARGEVTGLDFDPFLNSQDPAKHYEVHPARCEAGVCSVPIFAAGDTTGKDAVTAEITQRTGQWRFTNFRYPDGRNLLQVLQALQSERAVQH